MNEKRIIVPVSAHCGTLAGNATLYVNLPFAYTMLSVISCASNATNGTLAVGNATNTAYYLTAHTVGASGTAVVKTRGNWNTAYVKTEFPHVAAGTTVIFTVDYDGSSGTAAADLVIYMEVLVD